MGQPAWKHSAITHVTEEVSVSADGSPVLCSRPQRKESAVLRGAVQPGFREEEAIFELGLKG